MGTGLLLLLSLFAGLISFAPGALAHHPDIDGSVACGYKVNWTATSWAPDADDGSGDNDNVIVEYQLNGAGPWTQVPTGSPGVFDAPDDSSFSGSFVAPGTPTSVTLQDRTPDSWGNTTAGGQTTTGSLMPFPTDCAKPDASAEVRCANDDILVTLTNDGTTATTATINKNGTTVGNDVPVPVGSSTFSVGLDDVDENTDVTITVDFAVGTDPEDLVLPVDCKHPIPGATADLDCAEGVVVVTLSNSGDDATTVDISKNGVLVGNDVSVPVGSSTFSVGLDDVDENTDVTITVDFAVGTDPEALVVPVNCEQPEIESVQLECAEGGVVVVLTNDGALPTIVLVDGIAVEVPAGAGSSDANPAIRVTVPVDENADYDFTVVGDELEQQFTGTADCLLPEPSVDNEVVCASGGLNLVLRNTGDDTATFVITSPAVPGGEDEETVVAGASESYLIPLAEDATTDVLVTSGDEVLYDANVVRNCETVGGQTVTRGPSSLPRTGGNTTGLLSLAGALLLAGAALVVGRRRRQAEVLS